MEKARFLICIEKNQKFIPVLEDRFKEHPDLKLINDDALKTYLPKHDRFVSNLPYMISEAIFQRMLRLKFKSATFIVSENFANILTAAPGHSHFSKLSWLSNFFYESTIMQKIPTDAYFPEPQILTSIINLKPKTSGNKIDIAIKELIQQGDKHTKNALREALIRAELCSSKKEAKGRIEIMDLDSDIQNSWVSRLSLEEFQYLDSKLRQA